MLKIRDDIDLIELERLGFQYDENNNYFRYNNREGSICYVFVKSRKISSSVDKYANTYWIHDIIFDLIEEGFVERIEKE